MGVGEQGVFWWKLRVHSHRFLGALQWLPHETLLSWWGAIRAGLHPLLHPLEGSVWWVWLMGGGRGRTSWQETKDGPNLEQLCLSNYIILYVHACVALLWTLNPHTTLFEHYIPLIAQACLAPQWYYKEETIILYKEAGCLAHTPTNQPHTATLGGKLT